MCLRGFDSSELEGAELEIRCGKLGNKPAALFSVGLFRFLYSQSLQDLVQASRVDPSGVQLSVDTSLLQHQEAPPIGSGVESEDDVAAEDAVDVAVEWEGVPH